MLLNFFTIFSWKNVIDECWVSWLGIWCCQRRKISQTLQQAFLKSVIFHFVLIFIYFILTINFWHWIVILKWNYVVVVVSKRLHQWEIISLYSFTITFIQFDRPSFREGKNTMGKPTNIAKSAIHCNTISHQISGTWE